MISYWLQNVAILLPQCSMFLSKFQHGCFPTAIVLLRESAAFLEIVFSFKRWCISSKNAWYVARTFRSTCYFLSEVLYSWNGYALHFWNKQCIFTCRETHYLKPHEHWYCEKNAYANKECWSLSSMLLGVVWQWQVDSLAEVGEKNIVLNTLWFPVRFCKHLQTFASRPWSQESKPTDSRFKMQDSRCRKTFWIQERLSRPWIEPWILNPTLLSFANACKRVFWNFPWVLSQDS